jgi:hypothetical protein
MNMRQTLSQSHSLNGLLRSQALLALWPRCFDASIEAYSSRDPAIA